MVFLKLSKNPYICFGVQPDHHQGVTSYTFYNPSICSFSSTCNVDYYVHSYQLQYHFFKKPHIKINKMDKLLKS
jgi:hypothetical protein